MKRHDEHAELDALLKSETQQKIHQAIQSLPEDSLSLAWRSSLNEKLRQARPIPRWRVRVAETWRPALALALTGCLAMVLVIQKSPMETAQSSNGLEQSLVSVHFDAADSELLTGAGLAYYEVDDTTQNSEASADWQADLGSL